MTESQGRLRAILLALLFVGMLVTATELLLLGHTERWEQFVPLVSLSLGFLSGLFVIVRPGRPSLRAFRAVMGLMVAAALAGLWFHYRGNVEFELEMYPSMTGLELFWNAIQGATPALAPGLMAHLGLLGLAYTYRHPLLREPAARRIEPEESES